MQILGFAIKNASFTNNNKIVKRDNEQISWNNIELTVNNPKGLLNETIGIIVKGTTDDPYYEELNIENKKIFHLADKRKLFYEK